MRAILLLLCLASLLPAAKNLEVYFIDVEGGQATLLVSPSGESLLIDAGWAGHNNRDALRIADAAKKAGVKKIDYLLITHYHADHVGGVPQLAALMPVRTFVDHGPNQEASKTTDSFFKSYLEVRGKGRHLEVKPGDKIPIKGLDVEVLTAAGEEIQAPLKGAGAPNPLCEGFKMRPVDNTENARSVGVLVTFGGFRLLDLGDLTWNKEYELACPNNKIGVVDLYVVTHHGMNMSGSEAIVHAIRPRVAIMNNGAKKGASPDAWATIRRSPGLDDIWQLHYAAAGGGDHNAPDTFIANTDAQCEGKWIRLTVQRDGSYTVFNSRNNYTKSYKSQGGN